MAWETVQYRLTSSCPLIQHNGRTANPLDKWAKLIKTISSKRAKTDADYEELARLEFLAGLYMGPDGPVLPAYMVDAVLVAGAKKSKQGQIAKSGVFCTEHAVLEYDGPRTAEELWVDERFRFAAIVRVQNARVSRMRPQFDRWQAVITLKYDPNPVDLAHIDAWLAVAGTQIGLGDWRPQHGRFEVERIRAHAASSV